MIKIKKDKRNTNKHTKQGLELLDKSIDNVGIIESYTISNDNVIISGNARHEKISNKFKKEPIVIETDGTEPIIIKRTDIESNTKKFHEASILANTTAHKNFNLDTELIEEIAVEYDIDVEEVGVEVEDIEDYNETDYSQKNKEIDYRYFDKMQLSKNDYCVCGTYPLDYNFKTIEPKYLIGMSVPPVMTAQIANQIKIQWLDKIK